MTLSWAFAAAMVLTTVAHLGRLVTPWRSRRTFDVDLTGAAMGVGMAIMLVGPLTPSASRRSAVLFAIPAPWFIVQVLDAYLTDGAVGHHLRQALVCLAMVYMVVVTAAARRWQGCTWPACLRAARAG